MTEKPLYRAVADMTSQVINSSGIRSATACRQAGRADACRDDFLAATGQARARGLIPATVRIRPARRLAVWRAWSIAACGALLCCASCTDHAKSNIDGAGSPWVLVDDFESGPGLAGWTNIDVQNETMPFVSNPQVSEIRYEPESGNAYMLRKPAADGVVGNRKAMGFKLLPKPVGVGETCTFYVRINVEYFPNNQSFGLSNLSSAEIPKQHYDSFEPMIRITDKMEPDGFKNDGTLMVLNGDKVYRKITNPATREPAKPMSPGQWYELWFVVNNAQRAAGGQRYDLYVRGGEFATQQMVFEGADFRMRRELPLTSFTTISNTGPPESPYGNGGVQYDDIHMAEGLQLSSPLKGRSPREIDGEVNEP